MPKYKESTKFKDALNESALLLLIQKLISSQQYEAIIAAIKKKDYSRLDK